MKELRVFEGKCGISSSEFCSKWKQGLIPELEDPIVHEDFIVWESLAEELNSIESKLKRMLVKV